MPQRRKLSTDCKYDFYLLESAFWIANYSDLSHRKTSSAPLQSGRDLKASTSDAPCIFKSECGLALSAEQGLGMSWNGPLSNQLHRHRWCAMVRKETREQSHSKRERKGDCLLTMSHSLLNPTGKKLWGFYPTAVECSLVIP